MNVFHCKVLFESVFTDEYFDVLEQRIARYEQSLPRLRDDKQRELVEIELARLKPLFAARTISSLHREASIVIGSRSIQIAVPSAGTAAPPIPIEHSRNLIEECSQSIVLCWSASQEPNAWMWQGKGGRGDGVFYATLSSRRSQDLLDFPVIPIGPRDPMPFEQRYLSPFDAFFEDGFTDTRVTGIDQVDGEQVVVIMRTSKLLHAEETVRASLSIDRNFFPVRIERNNGTLVNVESFHETPQGAFYPSRWTVRYRAADDRSIAVRNSPQPGSVQYIRSIETWTVDDFRSDQPQPRLLSEIGFPKGTYCLDEDKNVFFTIGNAEEVINTVLDENQLSRGDRTQNSGDAGLTTRPVSASWLLWLNITMILGIFSLLVARRLWKRPEK